VTTYAAASLVCAVIALLAAVAAPKHRKAALVLSGAFVLIALVIFGIDCAISCVRTGALYVPKR
jgi:hypothetical protein